EKFPELFNDPDADLHRAEKARCIHGAARIIAITEATKRDLCAITGVAEDKVEVVHLGVNTAVFYPAREGDRGAEGRLRYGLTEPYLLYVGARTHYKNFPRFLEAFAGSPLHRALTLALVGGPLEPDEQALASTLGVSGRMRFISFPSDAELRALYQGA